MTPDYIEYVAFKGEEDQLVIRPVGKSTSSVPMNLSHGREMFNSWSLLPP